MKNKPKPLPQKREKNVDRASNGSKFSKATSLESSFLDWSHLAPTNSDGAKSVKTFATKRKRLSAALP